MERFPVVHGQHVVVSGADVIWLGDLPMNGMLSALNGAGNG
jgi:hypothetical protein